MSALFLAPGAGFPASEEDRNLIDAEPYAEYTAEERARIQRCAVHKYTKGPFGGYLMASPNVFGDYHWSCGVCAADCPLRAARSSAGLELGAGAGADPDPEAEPEPEPYSNYSVEERAQIKVCPTHRYGGTPSGGWLAAQPSCAVSGPWGSCGCPASREPAAAGAGAGAGTDPKERIKEINASLTALLEEYRTTPRLDDTRWISIQIGLLQEELEELNNKL